MRNSVINLPGKEVLGVSEHCPWQEPGTEGPAICTGVRSTLLQGHSKPVTVCALIAARSWRSWTTRCRVVYIGRKSFLFNITPASSPDIANHERKMFEGLKDSSNFRDTKEEKKKMNLS